MGRASSVFLGLVLRGNPASYPLRHRTNGVRSRKLARLLCGTSNHRSHRALPELGDRLSATSGLQPRKMSGFCRDAFVTYSGSEKSSRLNVQYRTISRSSLGGASSRVHCSSVRSCRRAIVCSFSRSAHEGYRIALSFAFRNGSCNRLTYGQG